MTLLELEAIKLIILDFCVKQTEYQSPADREITQCINGILKDSVASLDLNLVDHYVEIIKQKNPIKKFEADMNECGMYNCKNLKSRKAVMCESCYKDYQEDPDAYK